MPRSDVRNSDSFGPLVFSQGQNDSIPDFSILFEDGILVIGPLGLAILLLSCQLLWILWNRPQKKVEGLRGPLFLAKEVSVLVKPDDFVAGQMK